MFESYLKTAVRSLRRRKGYAFINIAGLTLSLACCLLIFQYVAFEYSFDDFNDNAPDLYRVTQLDPQNEGASNASPLAGYALGPALSQEVPEVMHVARLHPEYGNIIVSNPDNLDRTFEESRVYYADPAAVARKGTDVLQSHLAEAYGEAIQKELNLQPLRDIHLNEKIGAPKAVLGSYRAVYFFTLIGLATLLIALVNYVNLATARSLDRAREVGMRKAVGARRQQLIVQFLCESTLTNLIAVALAVLLSRIARPVLADVTGASLPGVPWGSSVFWAVFLATFVTGTLLTGLYPAFVLSSFGPVAALKGKGSLATRTWLRHGLVVFQFAVSITLLVGTGVVHRQLGFMRHMDLGIDLDQILTVPGPRVLPESTDLADAITTFTQEVGRLPAVRQTATSSSVPGQGFVFGTTLHKVRGDVSEEVTVSGTRIDTSFVSLYGLELIAGGELQNVTFSTTEVEHRPLLANETAIRAVGFDALEEAIGQEVGIGRVVGVVKDFSWSSAHQAREKAFFVLDSGQRLVSVKVSTENLSQTIASIEGIYKQLFPGNPFRYSFVDEQFDQQYRGDQRFAILFSLFAGLALLIACLGLFGLVTYTAQQRTKEIGIRKVLGASVASIVALLSKDFLKLVALGFALAAPLAWLAMRRWLEDFAYRIELGPGVFLLAGAAALFIALATVSYQAFKAARTNPTEALRSE